MGARAEKANLGPRHRARQAAVQALYQWQLTEQSPERIEEHFILDHEMHDVDMDYFHHLVLEIPLHHSELDDHIAPHLDRNLADVDPVERAILRLGAFEFEFHLPIDEDGQGGVFGEGVFFGKCGPVWGVEVVGLEGHFVAVCCDEGFDLLNGRADRGVVEGDQFDSDVLIRLHGPAGIARGRAAIARGERERKEQEKEESFSHRWVLLTEY